jgi:hypothetical protein
VLPAPATLGVGAGRSLQRWKARQVAQQTPTLSREAVAFVDRHLAMQRHDPEQAAGVEQAALDARGVWFDHRVSTATTDVTARLETLDALDLQASVGDLAGLLGELGDDRSLDVRQAAALGLLAHPQRALDLAAGSRSDTTPATRLPLGVNGSKGTLFLHVTTADLEACAGGGRVERLGPATLALLQDSRSCDLDHLAPYVPPDEGGPPGQTSSANLARLCRRHHRLKTFTAWIYQRLPGGDYLWTDPWNHTYLVTP